ncbi:MAG: hypothetical protein Q9219_004195 [cf. Caloplaca sp. 3 TL-2023]
MQHSLACLILSFGGLLPRVFSQSGFADRSVAERSPKQQQQAPMMNIPLPGFGGDDKDQPTDTGEIIISDVIGKDRAINIFAGFTRDIDTISKRLDDKTQNTTVLAPLNSEIQKLPRKPWEDPTDYDTLGEDAYQGAAGEDRAHRNLRRFVEAHTVPASPWKEGQKIKSIGGGELWWENKDGTKVVSARNGTGVKQVLIFYRFSRTISKFPILRTEYLTGKYGS